MSVFVRVIVDGLFTFACLPCSGDTPSDYMLCCTLSGDTPPDCPFCSTLSGDTTTDYPLCFVSRYYNRLSALLSLAILQSTIRSALSGDTPTAHPIFSTLSGETPANYPLCFAWRYCHRLLQLTIRSTDYPLSSLWRYYNRLSYVLYAIW
jgi:hypothetical protein